MKEVQEIRTKVNEFFTAEDILTGWKVIPGFKFGYTRCTSQYAGDIADEVVGLFEVRGRAVFGDNQKIAYIDEHLA